MSAHIYVSDCIHNRLAKALGCITNAFYLVGKWKWTFRQNQLELSPADLFRLNFHSCKFRKFDQLFVSIFWALSRQWNGGLRSAKRRDVFHCFAQQWRDKFQRKRKMAVYYVGYSLEHRVICPAGTRRRVGEQQTVIWVKRSCDLVYTQCFVIPHRKIFQNIWINHSLMQGISHEFDLCSLIRT